MKMEQLRRKPRWHFSLSRLKKMSPSGQDGVDFNTELVAQGKGASFIAQIGTQLSLPALTIFVATTFLHRFYVRYSIKRMHQYEAAAACVFLAAKLEETPRRLREVAVAATRAAAKDSRMVVEDQNPGLLKWIDSIMYTEELVLEKLFFDFEIASPYAIIARLATTYGVSRVPKFVQTATNFVNDSCRTMLSVVYPPELIASASIYWASKFLHVAISDVGGEKWYVLENLDRRQLVDVVNTMADMMDVVRGGVVDGQIYERIT